MITGSDGGTVILIPERDEITTYGALDDGIKALTRSVEEIEALHPEPTVNNPRPEYVHLEIIQVRKNIQILTTIRDLIPEPDTFGL